MYGHNTTDLKTEYESIIKSSNENEIYLFGYGSLLWKVDGFEYDKIIYGYVENYKRQFWLLSDDHRGTREKMGRVLTLVKIENEINEKVRVYGIAYRLKSSNIEKTFENLNFREKCGYSLKQITFYSHDNNSLPIKCVCYYANSENPYYSPTSNLKLLSRQIHETIGPSGTNKEYLYNLCNSLRILSQNIKDHEILKYDEHIFELECLVKQLDFIGN